MSIMNLCGKVIVSCVLENSNSLLNRVDMTSENEKCPPNSSGSAARSVLWGTEWTTPIFFIHFKPIRKKQAPIPYTT